MSPVTAYAEAMLFTPYIYGGNAPFAGIDCSGFICELLRAFGLLRRGEDLTAGGLLAKFQQAPSGKVVEGSLLFFGEDERRISHVAYALSPKQMIEAGGGDSRTTDIATAARQIAMVRKRPINWRQDLVAVRLPEWPASL